MAVHIRNGQVPEAQAVYRSLRAAGQWPHAYATNALLNAYANNFRWACCGGGVGGRCVWEGWRGGERDVWRGKRREGWRAGLHSAPAF